MTNDVDPVPDIVQQAGPEALRQYRYLQEHFPHLTTRFLGGLTWEQKTQSFQGFYDPFKYIAPPFRMAEWLRGNGEFGRVAQLVEGYWP
jgi:hypothetical protein